MYFVTTLKLAFTRNLLKCKWFSATGFDFFAGY